MKERYLVTGNDFISLPKINEATGAIEDFTFLHMGYKGLIDVRGDAQKPLIAPLVKKDGVPLPQGNITWDRLSYWVPRYRAAYGPYTLQATLLAPVGQRGFAIELVVENNSPEAATLEFGLEGCWASAWHCVNEDKQIDGSRHCSHSNWNHGPVFDMRCGVPMFAFAPMADKPLQSETSQAPGGITYALTREETLDPGAKAGLVICWGIGFEEVAAVTSAQEILRQGYEAELSRTLAWLNQRVTRFADPQLTTLYNNNLFFCIFFSTGLTLDTEELVLVTSRSPRYYVSAAYWDRDSLLWSFPAILDADPVLARQMLEYAFGRQQRNFGVHSRYIDGTVLEPGFELDELMAPILALERYIAKTGDRELLTDPAVTKGIRLILDRLEMQRHPDIPLYATFLQPTDDPCISPYLTYNNVLVWKSMLALASLYPQYRFLDGHARQIKDAIYRHCISPQNGKPCFVWSVDLNGKQDIYDEPTGSLLLLPWLGFCPEDEEAYVNAVELIRSPAYEYSFAGCNIAEIGCAHAPYPWVLSVANSLLCRRVAHCVDILKKIKMDNLIACESVYPDTGECATGEAFATCAGFLCHAMRYALEELE